MKGTKPGFEMNPQTSRCEVILVNAGVLIVATPFGANWHLGRYRFSESEWPIAPLHPAAQLQERPVGHTCKMQGPSEVPAITARPPVPTPTTKRAQCMPP
eukprot:6354623-Amphidinium_carterae.1